MKTCLSILSLVGLGVLALPAAAQPAPASPSVATPAREPVPTRTAGVDVKLPAPARDLQRVTAAGSVILLADGIVAQARIAQVQPPAPGFVYER